MVGLLFVIVVVEVAAVVVSDVVVSVAETEVSAVVDEVVVVTVSAVVEPVGVNSSFDCPQPVTHGSRNTAARSRAATRQAHLIVLHILIHTLLTIFIIAQTPLPGKSKKCSVW